MKNVRLPRGVNRMLRTPAYFGRKGTDRREKAGIDTFFC